MYFGEHVLTPASALAIFYKHEKAGFPGQTLSVMNNDEIYFVIRGFMGLFVDCSFKIR